MTKQKNNPFWHGTPVPPEHFLGREYELSQITGCILTGQSTAITGSPKCGKTSILQYLQQHESQQSLYRENNKQIIFSYLDAYSWESELKVEQFWEMILRPLAELFTKSSQTDAENSQSKDDPLYQTYVDCKKDHFSSSYLLEKFITQMGKENKRLILIVDGFDAVLDNPSKCLNASFFGNLRTLASRSGGSFALLISLNKPLSNFQKEVQKLTKTNAPYFNFIYEVRIGAFSEEVIRILLKKGEHCFEEGEESDYYHLIREIAGGHPYLLQLAASMVWEKCEQSQFSKKTIVVDDIIKDFFYKVEMTLSEIWQSWPGGFNEGIKRYFEKATEHRCRRT